MAAPATETHNASLHPVIAGEIAPSSITRLVAAAWLAAPEQGAAEAAVFAAEARLVAASRSIHSPELSLEAENGEVITKTLGLSQTVDMGGKRRLQKKAAKLALQAAKADFVASRQAFSANMLENLARYQNAQSLHQLAVRRTLLMQRFADAAEKRLAAGDIGPLDVALAKVAHTNAHIAQAGAQRVLFQAEIALRALTGTALNAWPKLPRELLAVPPHFALAEVIQQLPSVRALTARAEAQAVSAKRARRERIPDPTFGLTGGREGQENLIGLSVSFPLLMRSPLRAEARAASHEATQARQEVLREKRAAAARIEAALASYRVIREAWGFWLQSGRDSLTNQVTLLQRMWQGGDLSAADYLIQAGQNVEAQAAATELSGEVWLAALELLHVTGSLDAWLMSHASAVPSHSH